MKKNLKELFTYKDGNILLDGYDLVKEANMFVLSTRDFLTILKNYLAINSYGINGQCILSIDEKYIFNENTKTFNRSEEGNILVSENIYDFVKYQIFKLAFINCTNRANSSDNFFADIFTDNLKRLLLDIRKNYSNNSFNNDKYESYVPKKPVLIKKKNEDAPRPVITDWKVGDRVKHPIMGEGTVTQIKKFGNRDVLVINFDDGRSGSYIPEKSDFIRTGQKS